jgi:hypothetical protein
MAAAAPKVTNETRQLRQTISNQLFRLPGQDWARDRAVEEVDL